MLNLNVKTFVLIWNSENCGETYQDLVSHEFHANGGASSSIQLAEGVNPNEVMQSIYNETSCDLNYLVYKLCDKVKTEVQAIYITHIDELVRMCISSICVSCNDDNIKETEKALKFVQDVSEAYKVIEIVEAVEMFEYLHHLELTLENKVDNT